MIEGNFVVLPGLLASVAWAIFAWRGGYGLWTTALGVAAIAHIASVAAVTLFPFPVQPEAIAEGRVAQLATNNVIPLVSVAEAISTGRYPAVIYQSIGNLMMLVPLGIYGPLLWPRLRAFKHMAVAGLSVSLAVETLQFGLSTVLGYTYKIADVDDIILNTVGVLVGFGVYRFLARWARDDMPPDVSVPERSAVG